MTDRAARPRKIESVRTYLEMRSPPARVHFTPHGTVSVVRVNEPPVHFYRYLYNTIGERWLWYERRALSDAQVQAILADPQVSLHVLTVDGWPAGMGELDHREGSVELAYFGLMPQAIGKGYGAFFLNAMLDLAWDRTPERVWLHTNSLDHPKALAVYQRAGFVPYRQEQLTIDDPRDLGLIPMDTPLPGHISVMHPDTK